VPVRAVITDLDAVVTSLAHAKSVNYECDSLAGNVYARTDPDKLRQILINLLSNAVKFTPDGGRIRVSWTVNQRSVSIHVEDTGPGIPRDKHEAVFEPFVQLERGLTRTTEGTGLGLAISRGLARGMGGDILLESEVGAGSVFTVMIPLAPSRRTPAAARPAAA
jgi:signal transduction histidine kinase